MKSAIFFITLICVYRDPINLCCLIYIYIKRSVFTANCSLIDIVCQLRFAGLVINFLITLSCIAKLSLFLRFFLRINCKSFLIWSALCYIDNSVYSQYIFVEEITPQSTQIFLNLKEGNKNRFFFCLLRKK